MKKALTIAGSDSCGGAGIQADIKTMTMNGVYAMSAVTALTAQNTTGVTGIMEAAPDFLARQLDAVFEDIFPDAVKIGMVSSSALIEVIADKLKQYEAVNIVVDPVMVATSGARLIEESAIKILKTRLLPLATVITPNIPEAEILSDMTIKNEADFHLKDGNPEPYIILISGGTNDGTVGNYPEQYHNILKKNNVDHVWHSISGTGHDGSSVQPHLYNFIRHIFNVE